MQAKQTSFRTWNVFVLFTCLSSVFSCNFTVVAISSTVATIPCANRCPTALAVCFREIIKAKVVINRWLRRSARCGEGRPWSIAPVQSSSWRLEGSKTRWMCSMPTSSLSSRTSRCPAHVPRDAFNNCLILPYTLRGQLVTCMEHLSALPATTEYNYAVCCLPSNSVLCVAIRRHQ